METLVSMQQCISTICGPWNQPAIDSIQKTSKQWVDSLALMQNVNKMTFLKPLCWYYTKKRSVPALPYIVLMPDEENWLIEFDMSVGYHVGPLIPTFG